MKDRYHDSTYQPKASALGLSNEGSIGLSQSVHLVLRRR